MTVCTFTTQIVLASHPTKREFTYPPIIRRNSINASIDPFLTAARPWIQTVNATDWAIYQSPSLAG